MRVLHLTHFHSSELPGGVQQVVDALTRAQSDRGWPTAVVSGAHAIDPAGTIVRGRCGDTELETIHRREDERFSGDLGSERIHGAVLSASEAFGPDVVHVHHWHGLTPTIVRALAQTYPVVVTLHDAYTTCPRFFRTRVPPALCRPETTAAECAACLSADLGMPEDQLAATIAHRNAEFAAELRAAARVLAVSEDLAQRLRAAPQLLGLAIEPAPIGVTSNPGPVPPPARLDGRLRLAHWCGVEARKGLDLVADAVAASPHAEGFDLHVFGRELAAGTIERLRTRVGRATLVFHGPFSGIEGLRGIARTCDAALAPSLLPETHGLAVDEALLMGMPVVVGATGAPRHRIGSHGVAVPTDDPEPLRRVLERWLLDPAALDALRSGSHGARSLEAHIDRTHEIYGQVTGKASA